MKTKTTASICGVLSAMALGASIAWAAKQPAMQDVELNAAGQMLLARYSGQLDALRSEIGTSLPKLDEQQQVAFLQAYQVEAAATAARLKALRAQVTSRDKEAAVKDYGAAVSTDITLPFTIGMWRKTQPVEVLLVKGTNVLRFSYDDPLKGLTIKDFTLTPLK